MPYHIFGIDKLHQSGLIEIQNAFLDRFEILAIGKPYVPGFSDLLPFAGDLALVVTIVVTLLAPFFTRRANGVCGFVALAGLLIALALVQAVGAPDNFTGTHFRGALWFDSLAMTFKSVLFLFVIGIVLLRMGTGLSRMHPGDGPEFFCLLLGATLGMSLMSSTTNLLLIFMAIELASFPSYVLAGFRKSDKLGAEASLKYVLFGAASTSIMLYGLSMTYGLFGTMQLDQIASQMGNADALTWVSLLAVAVGIGFKIASIPFHFWCPDVFEGAAVDVAAFLSVASKAAALVLAYRVVLLVSGTVLPASTLAILLGAMAACTMTFGNAAALTQTNLQRLLAYSSIAQAGYIMCVLAMVSSDDSAAILLFYIAVYAVMNLGAFVVVAVVENALLSKPDSAARASRGGAMLSDLAGLGKRAPWLSASMAVCLFSLVGLPPVGGFFAKLNIMVALGRLGPWGWTLLAIVGVNTIVSLYVYLRLVKTMYFSQGSTDSLKLSWLGQSLALACAACLLAMFIDYGAFWDWFHGVVAGHSQPIRLLVHPSSG